MTQTDALTLGPSGALSMADVSALLKDPVPETRVQVVHKLAKEVSCHSLAPGEWAIALDILRLMANDAETRVRAAVSESLKGSEDLPRDVALKLARDDAMVAMPVLSASPVLTDDDLIAVLAQGDGVKQVAIAGRPAVSEAVSSAVVATGNAAAVSVLVENEGAEISEAAYGEVLSRYQEFEVVKRHMVQRAALPVTIAERLVALVSDRLKAELIARHHISEEVAGDAILAGRERATLGLAGHSGDDLPQLIRQLIDSGRMSASLILRALCLGDITFAEEAMAQCAKVPRQKAAMLMHDAGSLGLKAIYKRCAFPEPLYAAFRVAMDVFRENAYDGGPDDRERFQRRMVERILTQYQELQIADLDYLFAKLSRAGYRAPVDLPRYSDAGSSPNAQA